MSSARGIGGWGGGRCSESGKAEDYETWRALFASFLIYFKNKACVFREFLAVFKKQGEHFREFLNLCEKRGERLQNPGFSRARYPSLY